MREKNGFRSSVLDGLVFVDIAFGDEEILDPDQDIVADGGGSSSLAPGITLDGGSA